MSAPLYQRVAFVVGVALLGVAVVAVFFGGLDALTAVGTFLAVVVALAIAVWGDDLRTFGRMPVLGLTLEPRPDHFQRFAHVGGTAEYDVRISVTNDGAIGARNAELVATNMEVQQKDGSWERDPVFMSMNLTRTHYGDTIAPIVHRGVPRPFDLLRCLDPALQQAARIKHLRIDFSTVVLPAAAQPILERPVALPDSYPSSKPAGKYRLTLAVVADGVAPVQRVVQVDWRGTWWDHADDFFRKHLIVELLD